jgi:hypothetical protein
MSSERNEKICWIDSLRYIPHYLRPVIPGRNALHPILGQDPLVSAIVVTVVIYLVVLLPLFVSGQWNLALDLPIKIGAIGTAWSLFFYWVGSHNYKSYLDLLAKAVKTEKEGEYQNLKEAHLKSMGNDRNHFTISVTLWLISIVIVGLEMYGVLPHRILGVFSSEWLAPNLRPFRLATIYLIGLVGILLAWTLGRLIIRHTLFLGRISYLEFRPSQHIYFLCMRPLFRINLLAAFGWSLGVALVGLLFRNNYTTLRIIFLGILGAVPTIAFFWPTWLFQEKLREIGMSRVDPLVTALLDKLDLASKDSTRWPDLFLLEEQVTKQTTEISLSVAWKYVAYLLTTFVIPILTAVIATVLTKYLENGAK